MTNKLRIVQYYEYNFICSGVACVGTVSNKLERCGNSKSLIKTKQNKTDYQSNKLLHVEVRRTGLGHSDMHYAIIQK